MPIPRRGRESGPRRNMNVYYTYSSSTQRIESTLQNWSWDEFISMLKNTTYLNYSGATITCGMDTTNLTYADAYSVERDSYLGYRSSVFGSVGAIAVCLVIILAAMIWLMFLSGHREGVDGISLNGFDRIPTEPAACLVFILAIGFLAMFWPIASVVAGYDTIGENNARLNYRGLPGSGSTVSVSVFVAGLFWTGAAHQGALPLEKQPDGQIPSLVSASY